jgi:hypothetical protein
MSVNAETIAAGRLVPLTGHPSSARSSDVGDQELPHGGARRTRRALREYAHIDITYNSCRNRHCPKCQSLLPLGRTKAGGAAAKQWLAEREADLLLVPY